MYNKQLEFIGTKASQTQVTAFWGWAALASQGRNVVDGEARPIETWRPLRTNVEPHLCLSKPTWHQWPKPVAGEEWGIEENWSFHFISVQGSSPLTVQEAYERGLVRSGDLSLMGLVGVRVSLCKSPSSSSQGSPQHVWTWKTDLSKRNKSWNLCEQLLWAQWISLYLEKLTMLSLSIKVLSEKGLRSTVACHRSQCVNTFSFSGASQGKLGMVWRKLCLQYHPCSRSLQSFTLHY